MMERSRSDQDIISILQNQIDDTNRRLDILSGRGAGDIGWITVGSGVGVAPAFSAGWSNYSAPYGGARFRKLSSGLVIMDGLVTGPAAVSTIFVLPAGYRPSTTPQVKILNIDATGGFGEVRIDTVGTSYTTWGVTLVVGSSSYVALSGVSFFAEN